MPAFFEKTMQRPDVQAALAQRGAGRGRGPFGGTTQMTGSGGFVQAPEATVMAVPEAGPASRSPYGPAPVRPENQRNRWAARRMAGQQMMMPGRMR